MSPFPIPGRPTGIKHISFSVCRPDRRVGRAQRRRAKRRSSNLVARFYDPSSGRVTLDGRDLRDYDVESFRSLLGIVEQDVFLFDGTIAQNIAYARRDATAEEIRAAAEAANADEFIDRMTDGMQTVIGERVFALAAVSASDWQ